MSNKETSQYMKGALILTVAAFIVKILSAIYRVPFQNIVGDIGFYIYQQVYPIYGIGMILMTSGFPVIISKLAAESESNQRHHLAHTLQAAFFTLLILGVGLFSFFYFNSLSIAKLMGDPLLSPLIEISAILFLFLPFYSIGRGYFQGMGNMTPTATSQVVDQSVRVTVIIVVAVLLVNRGQSLYQVGSGAIMGSIVGGFCGLSVLFFYAKKGKIFSFLFVRGLSFKKLYRTAQIVIIHGFVISISGLFLVLLQLIDSFTIYSLLVETGITPERAKVLKGIFDRGQPLLQLGTVVASSFALALVPLIAQAWVKQEEKTIHQKIESALKITSIIGLGAAIGLVNIIKPTNTMLFTNDDGSAVLAVLSLSIFFSSLILVCSGILQGLGEISWISIIILVGLIVKFFGNYCFIPLLGTMGAALATLLAVVVMTILFIIPLQKRFGVLKVLKKIVLKIGIASILMTAVIQVWLMILSNLEPSRLISTFAALSSVVIGGGVYLLVILKMRMLSDEELAIFPLGNRLVKRR